jgi:hypothetical protein
MGLQDRDYYNEQVAKQQRENPKNQQQTELNKLLKKTKDRPIFGNAYETVYSKKAKIKLVKYTLAIATITVSFNQLTPQELLQWHKNDLPKIKSSISHTVKKTTDFLKSLT